MPTTVTQTRRRGRTATESDTPSFFHPSRKIATPRPSLFPGTDVRRNGDLFEWYAPFEYLDDQLTLPAMDGKTKVLIEGCGTSGLAHPSTLLTSSAP